jgi:hypothetical protein
MVIDYGSISALATSLKTAADVTKAMVGLRDEAKLQSKIIELQGIILSAQAAALSTQSSQLTLLQRISQLEKEMADMEAWDAEKKKYELKEISDGTFAYVLKEDAGTSEPAHWLCATCYQHGKKSLLQCLSRDDSETIFKCQQCRSYVNVNWNYQPGRELYRSRP